MQYSNDENIIVFSGCPSQSIPPIGLLILGHWFCLKQERRSKINIVKKINTQHLHGGHKEH